MIPADTIVNLDIFKFFLNLYFNDEVSYTSACIKGTIFIETPVYSLKYSIPSLPSKLILIKDGKRPI